MLDLYFIRSKSASKSALKIHSEPQQLPQIILLHLTSWLIIRMHHFFFVMMTNSMSAIWKEGHLLFRANCKVRTCFRFFVLLCVGKEHIETIWRPLANDKWCRTRKKLHKVSTPLHASCPDKLLTQVFQTIVLFHDISAELQFSCCKLHCGIESLGNSVS